MTISRDAFAARASHIRANPLDYALLVVAFIAIGFTMYETVAVALKVDRTQDLTFSGTTAELGRTLSSSGPARIGRLQRATILVGRNTVIADTIVVVVDSVTEPAFATGGFMRDQVALYNDYAIRQALLSSHYGARGSSRSERGRFEGRTLLRTV